jgi:hypothetical protein
MTSALQPDVAQLRAEIESIRSQANDILYRLSTAEHRLESLVEKKLGRPAVNGRSLEEFVVEVLENSNEPLTAAEISDLVLEAGYETKSGHCLLFARGRSVVVAPGRGHGAAPQAASPRALVEDGPERAAHRREEGGDQEAHWPQP